MKWFMRFSVLLLFGLTVYINLFYKSDELTVVQSDIYLLNEQSSSIVYKQLSPNTYNTDIVGLSTVVNRILEDGWSCTRNKEQNGTLDLMFEKDNTVYRIYYRSDGNLTFLASPYQRSSDIQSYMYEKE